MANCELRAGDIVAVHGLKFLIEDVWSQDYRNCVWDVEFVDNMNCYHHWKSDLDGGYVIYKEDVA